MGRVWTLDRGPVPGLLDGSDVPTGNVDVVGV
jgi:hypothetical protein